MKMFKIISREHKKGQQLLGSDVFEQGMARSARDGPVRQGLGCSGPARLRLLGSGKA